MPERKGVELVIGQLAKTNPKAKGQTVESLRVIEPSILDEIEEERIHRQGAQISPCHTT